MPYVPDTPIDTKITEAVFGDLPLLNASQRELVARAHALLRAEMED